jgi:hypothetical protein
MMSHSRTISLCYGIYLSTYYRCHYIKHWLIKLKIFCTPNMFLVRYLLQTACNMYIETILKIEYFSWRVYFPGIVWNITFYYVTVYLSVIQWQLFPTRIINKEMWYRWWRLELLDVVEKIQIVKYVSYL